MKVSRKKLFASVMSWMITAPLLAGGEDPRLTLPTIQLAEPGSLQGSAAKFKLEASSMSQGSMSLPLPIDVDQRKGPLLMSPFPSYSPQNGLSAWGMGWEANLTIVRYREIGDIDFQSDLLSSPWGILEKGSDGFWYPRGLRSPVKVSFSSTGAKATLADGTDLFFQTIVPTTASAQDYGFALSRAIDKKGHLSLYKWQDDKQRLLLDEVRYGGYDETDLAYRIRFIYAPLSAKGFHFSFRSKKAIPIDRQITTVQFFDHELSLLKARWTFELQQQPSKYSPGFLLMALKKTYISGDSEPAIAFGYELFDDWIKKAGFETLSNMDKITASVGNRFVRPDALSLYDYNLDGLIDIETAGDHQLYLQSKDGFLPAQKFTPVTPNLCLPVDRVTNLSRTITRMAGYRSDLRVLVRESKNQGAKTSLTICSLDGRVNQEILVNANFNIDPRTAFGDVNQDGKPDFVRLSSDSYSVLLNTSEGDNFRFEVKGPFPIKNASSILQLDVADINGDGLADLVAKDQDQLRVFAGLGNLAFSQTAITFPFLDDKGVRQTLSQSSNLQYIDANADGLLDLSFTEGTRFFLLMNRGTDFVRVRLPELEGTIGEGEALTVNAAGSGEAMIIRTSNKGIRAMRLSTPGMNLMKSWDDGKGSVVDFAYAYGEAFEGQYRLPKVVSSWKKTVTGKGSITGTFAYDRPTIDEILPSYRGFESVLMEDPGLRSSISFQNPKEMPGLLTRFVAKDLRGQGLSQTTEVSYQKSGFRGLSRQVLLSEKNYAGVQQGTGGVVTKTYDYKDDSLCENARVTLLGSDRLEIKKIYDSIEGIDQDLSCYVTALAEKGIHGRSEFDFSHQYTISRNKAADPIDIVMINGNVRRVLQTLEYDDRFRLVKAKELGGLSHLYSWEGDTDLPLGHETSIGVKELIVEREPQGLIRAISFNRGSSSLYVRSFSYDSLERLQVAGDSLSLDPSTAVYRYSYEYATSSAPALVRKQTFATAGSESLTEKYLTADGDPLATLEKLSDGAVLSDLRFEDLMSGTKQTFARTLLTVDFKSSWVNLRNNLAKKSESIVNGFEKPFSGSLTHEENVNEKLTFPSLIETSGILDKQLSNGQFETWTRSDGMGRVIAKRDEAGQWTTISYDMIGRPREIRLSDGQLQSAQYDDFGQLVRTSRSSIGSINYVYNAQGLLQHKEFSGKDGTVYRTLDLSYDIHGRLSKRVSSGGGLDRTLSFYYDGFTPTPEFYPDQKGWMTAIKGDHFQSSFQFDQKGRITRSVRTVDKGGVKRVENNTWYNDDRLKTSDVSVDVADAPTRRMTWEYLLREDGLLSGIRLNSRDLATLSYNSLGLISGATLDGGLWALSFSQDAVTSGLKSYEATGQSHNASYSMKKDQRGNVQRESIDGKGINYAYDERSFLTKVDGDMSSESFSYDSIGLMRPEADSAAGLLFDPIGRLQQKGDLLFAYDGQGQISSVRMGDGTAIGYGYDENDLRNLKTRNGDFHSARIDDEFISKDHVLEPFKIGSIVVGYLDNGSFNPLLTDPRGTVIDDGKSRNTASAYGRRSQNSIWQSTIDIGGHWRDEDTGILRMGVRDMVPDLGTFAQPDPLFVENLDKCLESTVDCNLYSYARNNPLRFVDPTGRDSADIAMTRFEKLVLEGKSDQAMDESKARAAGVAVGAAIVVAGVAAPEVAAAAETVGANASAYLFRASSAISEAVTKSGIANMGKLGKYIAGALTAKNPVDMAKTSKGLQNASKSFAEGFSSGEFKWKTSPEKLIPTNAGAFFRAIVDPSPKSSGASLPEVSPQFGEGAKEPSANFEMDQNNFKPELPSKTF